MCITTILNWFKKKTPAPTPVDSKEKEPETPAPVPMKPQILALSWTFESLARPKDTTQFYSALNLHVKTRDYKDGEEVEVKLQDKSGKPFVAGSDSLSLKGTVKNNEVVFKEVFKDQPLDLEELLPDFCIQAVAPKDNVTSFVSHGRPGWKEVYAGYPKVNEGTMHENDLPANDVFLSVLGEDYDRSVFSNACATRISIALNHSGLNVKKDFMIGQGPLMGKGMIASALNLKNWLSSSQVLGEPDVVIKKPQSLEELRSAIGTKKGIYVLESDDYNWASGHATLWYDGHAIGNHDYYSHAKEIYFWELI